MTSYYRATAADCPRHAPLEGRQQVDVAVVGGGFAGLATTLGLIERGCTQVALLESAHLGHGASGRNGGFVFGGYSRAEETLAAELGRETARRLYHRTLAAVRLIRSRIDRYQIDCFPVDAGVLWANWFRDAEVLRRKQAFLAETLDVHWDMVSAEALFDGHLRSRRYHGALWERDAFHMHPLRYAKGLGQAICNGGGQVFEGTPVRRLLPRSGGGFRLITPSGEVEAERVVLACGGYRSPLHRRVYAGSLPISTYVMVTEPLGSRLERLLPSAAAVYDSRFAFDYYRRLGDGRLLWGGRITVRDPDPKRAERLLRSDLRRVFPELAEVRVDYVWSGLMGYARHQMPQILEVEPGLWCAQAFGGHGVATTTVGGELMAAALAEGDASWRDHQPYGLVSAGGLAGKVGAQLTYWWLQARDAAKDLREKLSAV